MTSSASRPSDDYQSRRPGQDPAESPPSSISTPAAVHAFWRAPLGLALTSAHGVLVQVNEALCQLLGRPSAELHGHPLFAFTHPDDLPAARAACDIRRQHQGPTRHHECRLLRADGTAVAVQVATSWADPPDSEAPRLVMVIEDISDRKSREAHLRHQALHDPLTALPNRLLFEDRLAHALQRGRRRDTPTCVLMIDLDGFKDINDRYGHLAGDAALTHFAHRLLTVLRASDTAARLGGDEFAVVCEDSAPAEAQALAHRLRAALADPLRIDGSTVQLRCSIGVGHADRHRDEQDASRQMVLEADRAMYRDKHLRRAGGASDSTATVLAPTDQRQG